MFHIAVYLKNALTVWGVVTVVNVYIHMYLLLERDLELLIRCFFNTFRWFFSSFVLCCLISVIPNWNNIDLTGQILLRYSIFNFYISSCDEIFLLFFVIYDFFNIDIFFYCFLSLFLFIFWFIVAYFFISLAIFYWLFFSMFYVLFYLLWEFYMVLDPLF